MLFLGDKVKYLPNFSHNMAKIGIDIGGTKISAATISNNKVKNKVSITTNAKGSEKEIISQITKLIDKLINKKPIELRIYPTTFRPMGLPVSAF